MFSRKQVAEPRVLDLNDVVRDMEGMLRRLLGEDIDLSVTYGSRSAVRADVRELEQVLMNLAVNARDAMPEGGRLRIATADETRTEAAGLGPVVPPGDYVRLTVSDEGTGIPTEIQPQVFEPFFTTKPPERGTGLGLSTVYGIVAQVRGHIVLESELGHGATFTIYLPRTARSEEASVAHDTSIATGSETVLLVEDDASLRSVTREMLEECGYSVLEAANGNAAVEITRSFAGTIDLLVTDLVMPGLNGVETARQVTVVRPGVKVLFVSGYAALDTAAAGMADRILLHKPYTISEMAQKVREALAH
jgi:CheY-like chemotaxis protein